MLEKIEILEDGVVAVFSGVVTTKELIESNDQLLSHLEKFQYRYQLVCFNDIEDFVISAEEMRQAALRDVRAFERNPVAKVAIVSDSKLIYGLARMYDAFAYESTAETEIFETLDEAEQWLAKK